MVAYSPLVKFIAGRMASGLPSHVEESDLISYGLLGLIGAIERFEPERDIKFETFAVARVKGAIIDELRSLDWVPRSVRARARDDREGPRGPGGNAAAGPDRRGDGRQAGDHRRGVPATPCCEIANSSVLALDDLWTFADPEGGSQVSILDTIQDPDAIDPRGRGADVGAQGPARRRDRARCPSASGW